MAKKLAAQRRGKRGKRPRKPPHYRRPPTTSIDPIVVSSAEAMRLGCWGKTKFFELITAGELESYIDGRDRRVIVKSIYDYIARKRQESGRSKTWSAAACT